MNMRLNKIILSIFFVAACAIICTSCTKLSLQKDYHHHSDTVDSHVYKTAWEYLKQRALGSTANDTIWKKMYEGIIYSEIDTNEYMKPGRTYIFLNTDAITRTNSNPTDVGFFGAYLVNGKNGTKWSDYPKDFVKSYLQYLILDGVYDHYTLPAINVV